MSIKNCPDCCFMGDIDDDKVYPFGVLTEEESDQKYSKKEYEQKVDKNTADIKSLSKSTSDAFATVNNTLSDKAEKTELDAFVETTAESISELENTLNTKAGKDEVNELASDKADKAEVQALAEVVNTKASGAELAALEQTVDEKADKSVIMYVTPEMFGAIGDGETDDTEALQAAIDYAFLNEKVLQLSAKVYLIYKSLVAYGVDDEVNNAFASRIIGTSKGKSQIKKVTNIGFSEEYPQNAVLTLVNKKVVSGEGSGSRAYGISLENFCINGNNVAEYGLCMPLSTAEGTFRTLEVKNCTDAGIIGLENNYLNLYEQIRVHACENYGFRIDGHVQTSDNFLNCYVVGGQTGYKITGQYMQMTNCCADSVKDVVCDLRGFRGTVTSFGAESQNANVIFKFGQRTNVTVISPQTWGNFTNEEAVQIECGVGSKAVFIGGVVSYDSSESDKVAPGYLYKLGYASELILDNVSHSRYAKENTYNQVSAKLTIRGRNGTINNRYGQNVAYVGLDSTTTGDAKNGNAIYLGFDNRPNLIGERDVSNYSHIANGDILISQKPNEIGGAGWIQAKEYEEGDNSNWSSGEFLKIPVLQYGTHEERPTSCTDGQSYYDTEYRTPIFFEVNRWRSLFEKIYITGTCDENGFIDTGLQQNAIIVGVANGTRSGWMYSWYYESPSWKIKCSGPVNGKPATGDFGFNVYYILARRFLAEENTNEQQD